MIIFNEFDTLKNKDILIVDDSYLNSYVLQKMIEITDKSMNTYQASSGKEAVKMCKDQDYGLVFMDIIMPEISGIEATEIIKKYKEDQIVIGITGQSECEDECRAVGMDGFILKPVELDKFKKLFKKFKV